MRQLAIYFALMLGSIMPLNSHGNENDSNKNSPVAVILLGAPGSGKGTQASRLAADLGIPQISTGDLFRANIQQNTPVGREAKLYIDKGEFVPDSVVLKMLFDRLEQPDCAKGYILDGFPRTEAQAKALSEHLALSPVSLKVLNLEVHDDKIALRATGRLICQKCGHIHHRVFSPPKEVNLCDKCQGPLYQRSDDNEEVIRQRLALYHQQTAPLIEWYRLRGHLVQIDGEQSPEAVYRDVYKAVTQ